MPTFKRQTHGIRVNLSKLEQDIRNLEVDRHEMYKLGYVDEGLAIAKKIRQLEKMKEDAVKHGYGYYAYQVSSTGRNLVLVVAALLALLLLAGYLMVVFG